MNMSPPPPDDRNPSKKQSFEELIKAHSKQLENIPSEMKIAPLPPSDAEAEETKEYVRQKLGLSVSETPVSKIFLANEILERASILEGRIGEWEGLVAFLFLYRFGKTLKTIFMVPTDGLDARMIAKSILWGYVSDLPPQFAQSEITSSDRFFQVRTFNLSKLGDMQVLEKFKSDFQRAFSGELTQERTARRTAERALSDRKSELEQLREESDQMVIKLRAAYDSAFRWNMAALVLLGLVPVAALASHYFRF